MPPENAMLCRQCGYVLDGLPGNSNCPECGSDIAGSIDPFLRHLPPWEMAGSWKRWPLRYAATVWAIWGHPSGFFRTLRMRVDSPAGRGFERINWFIAALMLTAAAVLHLVWFFSVLWSWDGLAALFTSLYLALPIFLITWLFLMLMIGLSARLTAWEAGFRGYRLSYRTARRVLYYHSAHLLPVAAAALVSVAGHSLLCNWQDSTFAYLYSLSGQVIVSAAYLFLVYWLAMRNALYANY